jgi:hypothetical protein
MDDNQQSPMPTAPAPVDDAGIPTTQEPMPTPPPSMPQQAPSASVDDAVEPGSEITPVADPPAVAEDVAPTEQMPPQN